MKVMVLYANAGDGHRRAAEALAIVCRKEKRISEVRLIDALQYTNRVFQELYAKLYIEAVKRIPSLWSFAFDETDRPWRKNKGRKLMHLINGLPLLREIKHFKPDLCLCTHFMPTDILSIMLRNKQIQTELGVVVTDYYVHATWLESYVSRVYVAKEESREQLLQLGYPPKRVKTLGIPINPLFGVPVDRQILRAKHNIDSERPLVLLSAGAFGVMSSDDMAQMLIGITSPCHLAIICGNNKKLKAKIEKYIVKYGIKTIHYHILGFTKEIHEWMKMASLFIGKPGGLTSSECLACGLPMVIWNPIPGQEIYNAVYLLEHGVGIAPDNISTLSYRIDQLLQDSDRLAHMKTKTKALSRPNAAQTIVNDAIKHYGEGIVKILVPKKSENLFHKKIF